MRRAASIERCTPALRCSITLAVEHQTHSARRLVSCSCSTVAESVGREKTSQAHTAEALLLVLAKSANSREARSRLGGESLRRVRLERKAEEFFQSSPPLSLIVSGRRPPLLRKRKKSQVHTAATKDKRQCGSCGPYILPAALEPPLTSCRHATPELTVLRLLNGKRYACTHFCVVASACDCRLSFPLRRLRRVLIYQGRTAE